MALITRVLFLFLFLFLLLNIRDDPFFPLPLLARPLLPRGRRSLRSLTFVRSRGLSASRVTRLRVTLVTRVTRVTRLGEGVWGTPRQSARALWERFYPDLPGEKSVSVSFVLA